MSDGKDFIAGSEYKQQAHKKVAYPKLTKENFTWDKERKLYEYKQPTLFVKNSTVADFVIQIVACNEGADIKYLNYLYQPFAHPDCTKLAGSAKTPDWIWKTALIHANKFVKYFYEET